MTAIYPKIVNAKALCLFLLLFSTSIYSQYNIKEGAIPKKISLHPYALLADAGQNELSINQVAGSTSSLKYSPLKKENADLGFTDHHYWVKFQLRNETADRLDYLFETARPITDKAELFAIDSQGNIKQSKSGDRMRFSDRDYPNRKTVFKISLPPNATQQFYLHLKSDGEVVSLPLMLQNYESFAMKASLEHFLFGIFYGILGIVFLIYLFFFFGMRQRLFLYYSLYVIFIGFMQLSLDGYFYQYIAPEGGWISKISVLLFATISAFLMGKYAEAFLNIRETSKTLSLLFKIVYAFLAVLFFLIVAVPPALKYCYPMANLLGMCILFLILGSLAVKYAKGKKVDIFFTAGILFLVAGFVIFILNNFSQIPNSFFAQNSSKIGTGLEVVFLSLSMANLIRNLRDERETLNIIALKRSEEISELKSYFLSNISHELRTPLNAIMNLTDVMANETGNKEIRKNCNIIKYSSYSLLSSVNDILDFSKIAKGELKMEENNFQPENILEHIKNNAELRAKEQGLDFQYVISDSVPKLLHGDVNRLAQILNNVLSNAIKFTPDGFVRLTVESNLKAEGMASLIITIEDSGIGIPKEKMDSIFDSFTQETVSNTRKYGGLGLGLYITKTLVDMQGGKITVDSVLNQGTTFVILIDYQVIAVEKAVAVLSETPVFDLNGKNILVVEDNAINQMVIKKITQKWLNTNVIFANNGQEGLECFKTNRFDLVLMDLQMPVMDGYEATIAIRNGHAGAENSQIPIIAVTADVMETTKERVIEIGMNHYLSKPIKGEVLFDAIKSLVS